MRIKNGRTSALAMLASLAAALVLAGCGGGSDSSNNKSTLDVLGAARLVMDEHELRVEARDGLGRVTHREDDLAAAALVQGVHDGGPDVARGAEDYGGGICHGFTGLSGRQ